MAEENRNFDFIIIGAGVIGCNIARELAKYTSSILVLEKEEDVASGVSKGNSGVLHAGFYQPPGTLKAKMNVYGHSFFPELAEELGVEVRINGKLVIAMDEAERKKLEFYLEQGEKDGVKGLRLIDQDEIRKLEPNVLGKYAMISPGTGIIEPYKFVIALAENAASNGVKFHFLEKVIGVQKNEGVFYVKTEKNQTYTSRWLINAAGMFSDDVSRLVADTPHKIYPVRGEYYVMDKAPEIFTRMIYPVPPADGSGLGIHFTPTIDGNILIGPSANWIDPDDKEDTACTREVMDMLKAEIKKYIPKLANVDFIRNFANNRAKLFDGKDGTTFADFVIQENPTCDHLIDCIGIESPGLTAAPAIAEYVRDIIAQKEDLKERSDFNPHREKPIRFAELPPEEQAKLIEENEEYGIMVCRCETVTQAEIVAAIENPLGVRSLDAIKRRCRAQMGRCQGGFCTPRIVELLIDRYGLKPEEIYKNNKKSPLFLGYIKQ